MRGELTPEHMMTGANYTRVDGMYCVLNFWRRPGKKRWMIGPNALRPSCLSGSERDLARKLESLSLPMMKMRDQLKLLLVLSKKKKRRRKKRNKCIALMLNQVQYVPTSTILS